MTVYKNPVTLEFKRFTRFWRFNRSEVKRAVTFCGFLLGACTDEDRNDKEIVMMAVAENGDALQFVLGPLRDQDDVVACAVERTPTAIRFSSFEHMQRHPSAFKAAMKPYGCEMLTADKTLKRHLEKDRYMAAVVVRANGELLQYLPEKYKSDAVICEIAMWTDYEACQYVEVPIETCEDVAVKVLSGHTKDIFGNLPKTWRGYEPLVRVLLPESEEVYIHAANKLKMKYTLLALTIHGNCIASAIPMHIRRDEGWIIDMLRALADGEANCNDPSFRHLWQPSGKRFWKYIPKDLRARKEELMFAACSHDIKGSPTHDNI